MTMDGARSAILMDAELRPFFCAEHVMSMPAMRRVWTVEEVERLVKRRAGRTPRYELVDGQLLVTPAPSGRHQRILGELFVVVREYVKRHRIGEVRFSPGTVRLTPNTRFEPDIYVIPAVDGRLPRAKDPVTHLLLAAEILS